MGLEFALLLIALALGLLVLPIWWIFAAVMAALWHEFCHYFALRISGGRALGLRAGLRGAVMEVGFSGPGQEIICALAGPLGSLCLLCLAKWLPRTAICAGFHGLYNLMPIYPLDGGRIVRCLTERLFDQKLAEKVCKWLEIFCISGLLSVSFYGCFVLHLGIGPLLIGGGIIWRVKIPCKLWRNSVQWSHKFQ